MLHQTTLNMSPCEQQCMVPLVVYSMSQTWLTFLAHVPVCCLEVGIDTLCQTCQATEPQNPVCIFVD